MGRRRNGEENRKFSYILPLRIFISLCHRFTVSLLLVLILLLASNFSLLNASSPKEELEEIQKKLQQEKQKVKQTIKKEKSVLEELEQIEKNLNKKRRELKHYANLLSETGSKIRQLENDITLLNGHLETRKKYLRERLINLYKQQHGDIASTLISAKDYQDLARRIRYVSFLAYYDSKLMKTYSSEIEELHIKMRNLEMLQKELEVTKSNIKEKADEMDAERKKKDGVLASIRKERNSYSEMIKELEESSDRLRSMIKELDEKELPPPSVEGKGFAALKNYLSWPVKGKILVPYGTYKDPKFNIPTFRKGIEIKADMGNMVLSVTEGRVVYADWFKGYGLLLIINHGDGYHTLYAHLSEIFNKTGDIIKSRQAVGKIGESGILDEPSLYFEIRHKGKPINPLDWLKKE